MPGDVAWCLSISVVVVVGFFFFNEVCYNVLHFSGAFSGMG